jgi:carboxylesterase type B
MFSLLVETKYGRVLGFVDTEPVQRLSTARLGLSGERGDRKPVNKWLGIPYAQTEQRFTRPSPPPTWNEPRECFEFWTMFPQPPGMTERFLSNKFPQDKFVVRDHITQSEHSHFVNVFTPGDLKRGEKLPVMVFI